MTQLGDTEFSKPLITGSQRANFQSFHDSSLLINYFESDLVPSDPLHADEDGTPQGPTLSVTILVIDITGIMSDRFMWSPTCGKLLHSRQVPYSSNH
jgi:hypothetical protein